MLTYAEEFAAGFADPVLAQRAGGGRIQLSRLHGRTVITRASSASPLKLLMPRSRGEAAWIFTSSYGGGLVSGDAISLQIDAGRQTRSLLSTQSSTKVFRSTGAPCRQELNVSLGKEAVLVCIPDPVVCFAGANYEQRQQFRLTDGAALVMIDWFTSGRRARDERWAFSRYFSRTEVSAGERSIFQ